MKINKKNKKHTSFNFLYITLIVFATFFIGIGYSAINLITFNITGTVQAESQDGVFITDAVLKSNVSADLNNSKIVNINNTMFNSNITLSSSDATSSITYTITVYNGTENDYFFEQVLSGAEIGFYSNENITYELTNLTTGDILNSKSYATFDLTFKYKSDITPNSNINNLSSHLKFKFELISTMMDNITATIDSTSGVFTDSSTTLDYQITVSNNNNFPISYNLIGTSTDKIALNGIVQNVEVAANSQSTKTISLTPILEYAYRGEFATIDIYITLSKPLARDISNFKINVQTYASSFKDIITLYNPSSTIPDFKENITTTTGSGVFQTTDANGTAYYFRGVIDNNYLSFAGYTWRIMRLNGNGTIRIVLNSPIGTTSTYLYSSSSSTTYNGSNVESSLESWYSNNLLEYNSYIYQKALFLHDRRSSTINSSIYRTWDRLFGNNNNGIPNPTINTSGLSTTYLYSKSGNTSGNEYLTYPIGLLTADEIMFAGATYMSDSTTTSPGIIGYMPNTTFYLATDVPAGVGLWTMTPFSSTAVMVFKSQVGFFKEDSNSNRLLKPVIELKSTLTFTGTGTQTDPYIIYE